jgi:hypothetical protein
MTRRGISIPVRTSRRTGAEGDGHRLSLHVRPSSWLRYARGEKNDKRMASEFLERLIGDGKKHFQKCVTVLHAAETTKRC